ncbi:hypothetical protein PAEVO_20560 [Paenibacillus sp. GM2FR]|uniref:hypothetical protein n=1 Tax=Paenibacillus sp. GM2FR TaxID=2059268 RepID=UPI000C280C75|nr:hypothetical protein [Paenibacillus sp. GM2FR]PJN55335.1 hypothetical protein PAEVO_20560 [Paenibacillus sp. GM2FR]
MEHPQIVHTILAKLGNERLITELTTTLSQSEMTTLLLALSKEITAQSSPVDLLNKYTTNRFVKPSELSPIKLRKKELDMLELAEHRGFTTLELSPASPLGSCSVIAKVDQNKVISATRGVELMSDSTNMLAIYLANGIKNKTINNSVSDVHVCAASRVTRGQWFKNANVLPHFGLFTLVSSGRDTGSYRFEKDSLTRHIDFYLNYYGEKLGKEIKVFLHMRKGYTDSEGLLDRLVDHLNVKFPSCLLIEDRVDSTNQYYKGLNFEVYVDGVNIVDGGFVDWTQQLLGNKKERLLISGTGMDLQLITGLIQ